jgi:hypothetical protein
LGGRNPASNCGYGAVIPPNRAKFCVQRPGELWAVRELHHEHGWTWKATTAIGMALALPQLWLMRVA